MTIRLKPFHDRIIVRVVEETTPGGLHLPADAKTATSQVLGVVLAVGFGSRYSDGRILPVAVDVGETVMFARGTGTRLYLDGEELLEIREGEVMGIVQPKPILQAVVLTA